MTFEQINVLGQLLDTTFGRSSLAKNGTCSIKSTIAGNQLKIVYTTIVNIVGDMPQRDQAKEHEKIAEKLVGDLITATKKEFKKVAGVALKLKKGDATDDIEFISMSPYNPKRVAYYRRRLSYTINNE